MEIQTPEIFDYKECLTYLGRSVNENTYRVDGGVIRKLLEVEGEKMLIEVRLNEEGNLRVALQQELRGDWERETPGDLKGYIYEWFDLETPLEEFYRMVGKDPVLGKLVRRYHGLRMIRVPDLFEALSWSIIGQQINLAFAYQVKGRLVELCGNFLDHEGQRYYLFPRPEQVLALSDERLKEIKFSRQKIQYIREVGERMVSGELSKSALVGLSSKEIQKELTRIKGIGNWSAHYVMMRCLGDRSAFPVADVGLHNALKNQLGLDKKPSIEEIEKIAEPWGKWKGYGTYYLWRSLLG